MTFASITRQANNLGFTVRFDLIGSTNQPQPKPGRHSRSDARRSSMPVTAASHHYFRVNVHRDEPSSLFGGSFVHPRSALVSVGQAAIRGDLKLVISANRSIKLGQLNHLSAVALTTRAAPRAAGPCPGKLDLDPKPAGLAHL